MGMLPSNDEIERIKAFIAQNGSYNGADHSFDDYFNLQFFIYRFVRQRSIHHQIDESGSTPSEASDHVSFAEQLSVCKKPHLPKVIHD